MIIIMKKFQKGITQSEVWELNLEGFFKIKKTIKIHENYSSKNIQKFSLLRVQVYWTSKVNS